MSDINLQRKLHAGKDDVLTAVQKALKDMGLNDFDVKSIGIYLRKGGHQCPVGQHPVWVAVPHPDGSVTYQWVCQ